MIHEWYSGSDTTGRVPQLVALYDQSLTDAPHEERARNWRTVIDLERDRNWRAAFLTRLATDQADMGEIPAAVATAREALPLFDLFAHNFKDVAVDYCDALRTLLRYRDSGVSPNWEQEIDWGFALLCFRDLGDLPRWQEASACAFLAGALRKTAERTGNRLLLEMSLAAAMRAHKFDPDAPEYLAVLIYALAELGRTEECQRAVDAYFAVEPDSTEREELFSFVRQYLPAITAPPRVSM